MIDQPEDWQAREERLRAAIKAALDAGEEFERERAAWALADSIMKRTLRRRDD